MKIPFFNYKDYCKDLDYSSLLNDVLESGYLIGGPFIKKVEEEIQSLTSIKHCICVGNATDAMEIIFGYLKLPKNSNVLVPAHTMLATASAAKTHNLNPIPVDVDENSYMVEIDQLKKSKLDNVSAIMITQLNGVVADMDPISNFCKENKIALIEDSAQGIASFNNNKHSGSWGIGGCISFYPAKVVGCLGDGGALITNNDELAEYARSVRDHGRGEGLEAVNWGRNTRLDSLNANVILHRLRQLDELILKRRTLSKIYFSNLEDLAKKGLIGLPPLYSTNSNNMSTFQNFEIKAEYRDDLMDFLKSKNISTIKQWGGFSIAHFSKLGYEIQNYPSTKRLFDKLLLLPMNHMLKPDEVNYVSESIISFYKQ